MPRHAMPASMPVRIYVVGTDTGVGKTAVTAGILHAARVAGVTAIPFKPAQSGDDRPSDAERLLAAAGLPSSELDAACPLRYAAPLAPGLAEDPAPFLGGAAPPSDATTSTAAPSPAAPSEPDTITLARRALDAWEQRCSPTLTLIEGAGGLHVPMPGATWQPAWITALAPWTLVVGRAGLGTINHCLSTIEGLRALGRPPLGFVLSHTTREADPSVQHNAAVVARAAGVPCLGTLPHGPEPAHVPELLRALLDRLGR